MEAALAGAPAFPRFRSDLEVSEQRSGEATFYVLKDPASGRIYRLPESAYLIARQLDGASTPEDIRRRAADRFGEAPSHEELETFLRNMGRLGLLDGQPAPPQNRGPVRGDILYLRLRAFDPDSFLERLLPFFRFCFTPAFVAASAALVALAALVAAANWAQIRWESASLLRVEALFYAWLILFLNVSAHEIAHGLTCKHFGGRVREMGFMLIYFQPAFYCNVSDAWLIPEKSRRLWVSFAGAWLDMVLWALAVLLWRVTEPDTWIHFTCLVIAVTAGVRTFFNLNPLIKLDGYYLLSDWIEIPNLRARAIAYLGAWRRRVLGGPDCALLAETPLRERRIYLIYGTIASIYSSALLGLVMWWLGGFLVERLQGLGLVVFGALNTVLFRNRLRELVMKLPERLRSGLNWFHGRTPRVRALTLAGAALPFCLYPAMLNVSGEFRVLPTENADIRTEVEGIVEAIHVDEGQRVASGQLVAKLSGLDYRAEFEQIEASIREKQARLELLRAELRLSEQTLARTHALLDKGFVSPAKFQDSAGEVTVRRKAVEEAQAAAASLEAKRARVSEKLERIWIRSPHAGVVTTMRPREMVGRHLGKGDLLVEVHDLRKIRVPIDVPERDIGAVRMGQRVIVRAKAHPGESFEGKVTEIAPAVVTGDSLLGTKVVRVISEIDNPDGLLLTNMSGYAKVECGRLPMIAVLLRGLLSTLRVEVWSWL